jgi:hypothetical protein
MFFLSVSTMTVSAGSHPLQYKFVLEGVTFPEETVITKVKELRETNFWIYRAGMVSPEMVRQRVSRASLATSGLHAVSVM